MRATAPKVFGPLMRPSIDPDTVVEYLDHIGATNWLNDDRATAALDAPADFLAEFMGRLCYRSWAPGMNPNVTRVREDSHAYLGNIISSDHGSVMEHASYSFIFADVSRVFTHELVRHRVGTAMSQESLRYVRLTDIPFEHPEVVLNNAQLRAHADDLLHYMEAFQQLFDEETNIDDLDFHTKKQLTSARRRYAPDGVATTIGWTCNVRALRYVIAKRTDPSAEVEIRDVFDQVAVIMKREAPGLFQDFVILGEQDGISHWGLQS